MGIWDWQDERIKRAIRNLFKHNLCVTKEDKVLILSDSYKERIGELFFFVGTAYTSSITHLSYSPTGRHGLEPPEEVWRATFGSEFVEELKQKKLLEKVLKKENIYLFFYKKKANKQKKQQDKLCLLAKYFFEKL